MLLAVKAKRMTFTSKRVIGQCSHVGQLRLDHLALLQIVAGDDEISGWHWFDPCFFTCSDLCADR